MRRGTEMSTNITEDQLEKAAEAIKPLVLDHYTDLDAEDVAWDAARAAFEALGFTTKEQS